MRISDWSSDVCSSDLAGHAGAFDARPGKFGQVLPDRARGPMACALTQKQGTLVLQAALICLQPHEGAAGRFLDAAGDRKSVVEGKSVSVRVDLGGRRII